MANELSTKNGLSEIQVQVLCALERIGEHGGTAVEISQLTNRKKGGMFSPSYVHMTCRALIRKGLVSEGFDRNGGHGRPRSVYKITLRGAKSIKHLKEPANDSA